jgi:hypothetical protein
VLTKQEQQFITSVKNKIRHFKIPIKLKELFQNARNVLVYTQYNDGTKELVDAGIEWMLCNLSPNYFISRYCWIPFPGKGNVPFQLYYFQNEILRDTKIYKKLVFLKTRQCGISTLFSLYCFWRANFHESESIDVVSLQQKKSTKIRQ